MVTKNKKTYIDYAQTCFKSFEELEFNEVDSAIFSWLSYLLIYESIENSYSDKGMPIIDLLHAEHFDKMLLGVYEPKETLDLLVAVLANPRYRNAFIKYYRNESNIDLSLQFSALTISFRDDFHYVAFRGTDKTIHGWKEDFMLLMSSAPPAELMSVNYLDKVGEKLEGEIIVGGHSKGGHLAVYAASHCKEEVQNHISKVYSHDGPGFLDRDLQHPGMIRIRPRIVKTIPTGSIIGIILENETEPKYIKSLYHGVLQHISNSWVIDDCSFSEEHQKNRFSAHIVSNINKWAKTATDEELILFIDTLFHTIEEACVDDLNEIFANPKKYVFALVKTFKHIDTDKRILIEKSFMDAFRGVSKDGSANISFYNDEFEVDWKRAEELLSKYDDAAGEVEKINLFI